MENSTHLRILMTLHGNNIKPCLKTANNTRDNSKIERIYRIKNEVVRVKKDSLKHKR